MTDFILVCFFFCIFIIFGIASYIYYKGCGVMSRCIHLKLCMCVCVCVHVQHVVVSLTAPRVQ